MKYGFHFNFVMTSKLVIFSSYIITTTFRELGTNYVIIYLLLIELPTKQIYVHNLTNIAD